MDWGSAERDKLARYARLERFKRDQARRFWIAVATLMVMSAILMAVAVFLVRHAAAEETRVDTFDIRSNRTGSAVIDKSGERVDFFDKRSNRTGYGTIDKGGRIDRYDTKGNRTGSGQTTPGSRGKR